MVDSKEAVARILLSIRAVHFNDAKPFVFTSGTHSPVYVDCRKLISFPAQRTAALDIAREMVQEKLSGAKLDVIAGGETAGIPYAAWLADRLNLPMIYVRKQAKSFGRLAQIEGDLAEGAAVLLVEDLLFDAKSKIAFSETIRAAGGTVAHTLVLFDYANPLSRENLKQHGMELLALSDWPVLLEVAVADGYFSQEQGAVIRSFLDNPKQWSQQHGG